MFRRYWDTDAGMAIYHGLACYDTGTHSTQEQLVYNSINEYFQHFIGQNSKGSGKPRKTLAWKIQYNDYRKPHSTLSLLSG